MFHYFFPKINLGNPEHVDDAVVNSWLNGALQNQVKAAVSNKPKTALTLLIVANVPVQNSGNVVELTTTILTLLRYNVLATNDAITRLGGHPFDNSHKYYRGTGSFLKDRILNRKIDRYTADTIALQNIESEFQTSGDLTHPLVTIHTSGDQVIPYWHEPLYSLKVFKERDVFLHNNIPIIERYGHCNFTLPELLTGFGLMVFKVSLQDLLVPQTIFASRPEQEQEFLNLSHKEGINPVIQKDASMMVPN